jgi:hypothetical protein
MHSLRNDSVKNEFSVKMHSVKNAFGETYENRLFEYFDEPILKQIQFCKQLQGSI